VTSANNGDYFGEEATAAEDVDWNKNRSEDPDRPADDDVPAESSAPTMDITSAYTTVIRLMACLRGASGAARAWRPPVFQNLAARLSTWSARLLFLFF
jgi:hypothetical protein